MKKILFAKIAFIAIATMLLSCQRSNALTILHTIDTPYQCPNGLTIHSEGKDGVIEFDVAVDTERIANPGELYKGRVKANANVKISTNELHVLLGETNGTLTRFQFSVPHEEIKDSELLLNVSLFEKDGTQTIGGGVTMQIHLAGFEPNLASLPSGQYTGVGQRMVIADDGKPRYDDNLNICHLQIEADGSLKTYFPDEETPSRSREMHLQFSENKLRPKLGGPPIVAGTERFRDMWTGSFKGKTYRAVALPFSPNLYVFRLEIIQNEKLIAGEEQFYAICRKTDKSKN